MVSRILLADDSITIQKVVNLTFADEGIEVVSVSNGEMAARRLEEVNPDLVLADIFMPGKNGYELCETIKTNSKFRNIPVVLLVGAFEPFDQVEAKRVQADAHLTKPFESRILVETVRKLLGKTDHSRSEPLASQPVSMAELPTVEYEEPHSLIVPDLVEELFEGSHQVDFESASGEWTQMEMPANGAAIPTNGETLPLNLSHVSGDSSLTVESVELQASRNNLVREVPDSERPTGELVSPPSYAEASTQTGATELNEPPAAALDSTFGLPHLSTATPLEPSTLEIETQSWPAAASSEPLSDQQRMVVDFDESLTSGPEADSEILMVEPSAHLEKVPEARDWHVEEVEQAANEWKAANSRDFKTTTLEMPDITETPQSSQPAIETTDATAGLFSFTEAHPSAADSSGLFTADDPLGDVLFDDAAEPLAGTPSVSESALEASTLDESALTEFSLELTPDETVEQSQVSEPTATRSTGDLVTAELPLEGQKLVEYAAQDSLATEVLRQPEEVLEIANESLASSSHQTASFETPEVEATELEPTYQSHEEIETARFDASTPVPATEMRVSEEPLADEAVAYDWTSPGAVVHSTGRLDSMAVPGVSFEPTPETSDHKADTPQAPVAEAPAEAMSWESEPMGFAAIDVEASPVEREFSVQDFEVSDPERGFEISRALVDSEPMESHENGHRQPSDVPLNPIELSPMVIDEIVRRVVAQIGDSVVREIAWEIVPDCVERIIEQQTRDTLAKR